MNKIVRLNNKDFTEQGLKKLSMFFSEIYGLYIEMYLDNRGRIKQKWGFTGIVKTPMYIPFHSFLVKSIDFDSKTIEVESFSNYTFYIKDWLDKAPKTFN